MAGKGFRDRECRESIMQFERFRALSDVRAARQSGTCVKRFDERSSECRVSTRGARLAAVMNVSELSGKPRCFKNLHFEGGNGPVTRFEELPLWWMTVERELE
jgi:hypothetical protein